ncbi:ABC transporter substrate-binding protein [Bacillus rubiinfantis]|uniref:ABC transporter substrate-binding protein n=1 Tax=Bacillus rubiinfantis TaxID=1499680 RepID=UPI0005A93572|nr:ABC transporter substrate-binding protein [Bacillus rubiinfantis]
MKKHYLLSLLAIIMMILFSTGCQSADQKAAAVKSSKTVETVKPYTVKDDRGKEITFKKVPKKVISLQPSNTEILFSLGVGDKIVGVTDFDNYPKEAASIERVSDSVNVNAERIIELKPDAVIAYTIGDENALKPLEDAGIPVFVIRSATTFEDVYGDIQQISEVMGVKDKGVKLVQDIQAQVDKVKGKIKGMKQPARMYFEISPAPDIYTTGKNTFQQEILKTAGVENVFSKQEGWVKVTEEDVINQNPEIIVTTVNTSNDLVAEIKKRKGWGTLEAIKNNKVYQLDSDVLSRPGPRIGEAVELLAKTAYPEQF